MKLHNLTVGSMAGLLVLSATALANPPVTTDKAPVTQQIERLQSAQVDVEQESNRRHDWYGRQARQQLDQLNDVIDQLQQRKDVAPETVDRALLR
jgi:TolA-binding protein